VNRSGSLSMSLPHDWQSQIPFSSAVRFSGVKLSSYLGPPGDAAVICAATPIFNAPALSSWGPAVGARQSGREHRCPTRAASTRFVDSEKSSRILEESHLRPVPCANIGLAQWRTKRAALDREAGVSSPNPDAGSPGAGNGALAPEGDSRRGRPSQNTDATQVRFFPNGSRSAR